MTKVTTTIEIERSPEDVFAFLTDLENAPRWTVGLLEVRHDGPLGPGARGTDVRKMGRKQVEMPWRVTRYERPSTLEFEYGKPFPATATFTCEANGRGTQLSCEATLRLPGLYRLISPLVAREARKTDAAQFENAKRLLEEGGVS